MNVQFDPLTDEYSSAEHVEIRPVDFGGVNGFTYLDPAYPKETDRFGSAIQHLQQMGYEVGKNLFGAPYDFRLSGPTNVKKLGYFKDLKQLIEKAYTLNQKRVFLLGHSFGCTLIHHFLTSYISEEWKKQYIEGFISINGPFGGAVECFTYITGYKKWAVPGISSEESYNTIKYMAPYYLLLPNKYGFDEENDVIAEIPSLNITITPKNMSWVFESTAANNVKLFRDEIKAPQVKSFIFICTGLDTIAQMVYNQSSHINNNNQVNENRVDEQEQWWKTEGAEIKGDGDSSVNTKSLRVPHLWRKLQEEPVIIKEYAGADHSGILKDIRFLSDLEMILINNKNDDEMEL
ncbi:MAG: putative Lecithin:cholesterol acyltransferase family protein [Streblomastix strix]|uniref:Putative Lecithin:cholesterol acyltransferase family protein n=1 Tax=Streblomastix strix TaxID=222440 RepID=A0A5J4WGD6_9EUKA|nr:MAG: putative Lecithin:cholesterol acyltransferase family protein [Streblomastix strix]